MHTKTDIHIISRWIPNLLWQYDSMQHFKSTNKTTINKSNQM